MFVQDWTPVNVGKGPREPPKNGKLFINRRVPVKEHQTGTKKGAAGPRSGLRACETILKESHLN